MVSVQNWPELSNTELITYYNEIKANKVLKLEWSNPGRIDPKLYFEKKTSELPDENSKESANNASNPLDDVMTSSAIDINKFDLFDDDEELDNKKPSLNLRLIHSNTRSRSSDTRVACMDKILNDMRKNYETEQKQIVSGDTMMLVNDDFGEELNNKSTNESEAVQTTKPVEEALTSTVSHNPNQQLEQEEEKMESESIVKEDIKVEEGTTVAVENPTKEDIKPTETIETQREEEIEMKPVKAETIQTNNNETTNSKYNNDVVDEMIKSETQMQENKESEKILDYIETSTPYPPQSVNESDLPNEELGEKRDEIHTPLDQIDSIKSNRDYSSNELSDTTEEIETFTRKEPNRVLESIASTFNLTTTVQSLEKSENVDMKSDDQIKEVDSTTYKSQTPSPTRDDPADADLTLNTNTSTREFQINETKSNLVLENVNELANAAEVTAANVAKEEEAAVTSTSALTEDDPLISQDVSETTSNANEENSQLESLTATTAPTAATTTEANVNESSEQN